MSNPSLTASGEDRLVEVLDAYLARLQSGDAPDREAFLAAHPDLADDLETCLASLEFVCGATVQQDLDRPPHSEAQPALGQLGDFRLIREMGRGGMGVVYEAEQISLRRRVALKILPFASVLDGRQLARFKHEAQAAAQLHHTNIVPVFAVGSERAVHYYAMQYIEGQTLADLIRELGTFKPDADAPTGRHDAGTKPASATIRSTVAGSSSTHPTTESRSYFRHMAGMGIQIARALDYAHDVGVVHRDIKPSNLLLDDQGIVWIADFGLAQFQSDSGLTMTGELLGTLRYLSPEAVSGDALSLDHRADIYSLGITLYECLTLQPAFAGNERNDLLRRIAEDDPPALRRHTKAIPSELETIVLKAISKDPQHRYSSAGALADDLQRFLDDRPIAARRPTAVQRFQKTIQRHRDLAATIVASLLLLLVTVAVGSAITAEWLREERDVATAAASLAEKRLFEALLNESQAGRSSLRADRYFEAQRAVELAADLAPRLELTGDQRQRLMHEAVASMAGSGGLREIIRWPQPATGTFLDFDPDLESYARSDGLGNVVIYRTRDNRVLARLVGNGSRVGAAHFSPDGKRLYVVYPRNICVWEIAQRKPLLRLPHPAHFRGFDFSPDGTQLAIGQGTQVHVFELSTAEHLNSIDLESPPICIAFHPDGNTIAISHDEVVECREVSTGVLCKRLQPGRHTVSSQSSMQGGDVRRLAWNHDGTILMTNVNNTALLWNSDWGPPRVVSDARWLYRTAFSSQYDLMAATANNGVIIWDVITGGIVASRTGQFVRFDRDGRRIAFHDRHSVGVAAIELSDVFRTYAPRDNPSFESANIAVSQRWPLFATFGLEGVYLWSPDQRHELAVLPLQSCRAITFHDESSSLLTSTWRGLYRWPISLKQNPVRFQVGPPILLSDRRVDWTFAGAIVTSPDSQLLARCNDHQTFDVFDLNNLDLITGKEDADPVVLNVRQHASVCNIALTNDLGRAVTVTAHGRDVWLWNATTNEKVRKLWEGVSHSGVKLSPDGRWCLVAVDTEYLLFDTETWDPVWRKDRDGTNIWPGPIAFTPDSQLLALESSDGLCILRSGTGEQVLLLKSPGFHRVRNTCFGPDGRSLIEIADGRIGIWALDRVSARLNQLQLGWKSQDWSSGALEFQDADVDPSRFSVDRVQVQYGELLNPRVAALRQRRATQLMQDGFPESAIREYEEALTLTPENGALHNNLAWSLLAGPSYVRDAARALELAERAVELRPESGFCHNTLGVARYRTGNVKSAIEALQRSVEIEEEGTAFDFFFLAMSHYKLGEHDTARSFYDRAVEWWNAQGQLRETWHQELIEIRAEADTVMKGARTNEAVPDSPDADASDLSGGDREV